MRSLKFVPGEADERHERMNDGDRHLQKERQRRVGKHFASETTRLSQREPLTFSPVRCADLSAEGDELMIEVVRTCCYKEKSHKIQYLKNK